MFNFFHEWKFSPPHYLRSARTLVGKLALIWKQCPDMWGLGWNLHLWYTNWNVWYIYTQLDKISARYSLRYMEMVVWKVALSGRIKLIIAQFLQPFNPGPCFVSSFRRQRFSLTCISWYWNFEIKHVVFLSTIVEKTWYNLFGDFIFVTKSSKGSLFWSLIVQECSFVAPSSWVMIS